MTEPDWKFLQKLLTLLTEGGFDIELSCELVSHMSIDVSGHQDLDALAAHHAANIILAYEQLHKIAMPLFHSRGSFLHRLTPTVTTMLINMMKNYRVAPAIAHA